MGLIWARLEEERNELNHSRMRAAHHLERFRPDYIEDDRFVGLAPDTEMGVEIDDVPAVPPEMSRQDTSTVEGTTSDGGAGETQAIEEKDQKAKARERMRVDHLKLLQGANNGSRWTVIQIGRRAHVRIDYADSHGRTALFLASQNGHAHVLDALLGFRARMEKANIDGWTPLHAATFHGQLRCMEALIGEKANVNAQEKHGCTPLIFAASSPKLYLLDFVSKSDRLKRQKVRVDAFRQQSELRGGRGRGRGSVTELVDPAVVWKYYPNRIELIIFDALLTQPGIKVDMADNRRRTPLIYAARYGHIHSVSRLLYAKATRADPLIYAARYGHIHSVSRLLYAKATIRLADGDGRTALFHAACHQHYDVVDMLLRAGGSVNTQDQYFKTPLHGALEAGDEGMANLLLKAQASVQAYDCEGRTPIMMAMDNHNRRLFTAIVEHGSSLDVVDKRGWNVLIYAVEKGMLNEVMPLLVKLGPRVTRIIRARDPQGKNAVHHAAQLRDARASDESLKKLLRLDHEAAALGDCNGNTAFHMVAELGRLEAMQMLIEWVTQADFLNGSGETPLHLAAHSGHLATVAALIRDRGQGPACNAAAIDSGGWSLLMHACASGHLDLVNLLLQNREGQHRELIIPPLDVNHQDHQGLTALSVAAREGHWQVLPSLVLAGANCDAKDRDGFTALHLAVMEDEALAASCLLDLGLDPNARDSKNWTPMMHAAAKGCDDALRMLLDGGSDADARNWDGDTALQLCINRLGMEPPEKVKITKDILTDGMLDLDCRPRCSVAAQGHFMVSVLDAFGLYLEGAIGQVNAYVCLQLRTQVNSVPQVAFTSCTLKHPCPDWHEVFRFDTERLDPTACLVAWVIAAPGDSAQDVQESAMRGLNEAELRRFKLEEQMSGSRAPHGRPEFTTAIQNSFKRFTRRAEIAEDIEVDKLRRLAMAQSSGAEPTQDLLVPQANQLEAVPLEERRWTEVANMRRFLERSGCRVDEPLVPRSHLPMGCVVVRFRHLRAAVWGTKPIEVDRTLRLGCRGSLRLQVDFRPTFFVTQQKHLQAATREKEEELFEVTPADALTEQLELEEELRNPRPEVQPEEDPMTLEERLALLNAGRKHKASQEELFQQFVKVTRWSRGVLDARRKLGMMKSPTLDTRSVSSDGDPGDWESRISGTLRRYLQQYKAARELRAQQQQMMDKPIGGALNLPRPVIKEELVQPHPSVPGKDSKTVSQASSKLHAQHRQHGPRLPRLSAEPWLEELLEGSRLY